MPDTIGVNETASYEEISKEEEDVYGVSAVDCTNLREIGTYETPRHEKSGIAYKYPDERYPFLVVTKDEGQTRFFRLTSYIKSPNSTKEMMDQIGFFSPESIKEIRYFRQDMKAVKPAVLVKTITEKEKLAEFYETICGLYPSGIGRGVGEGKTPDIYCELEIESVNGYSYSLSYYPLNGNAMEFLLVNLWGNPYPAVPDWFVEYADIG